MTFSEFGNQYLKHLGLRRGASENTVANYERVFGMFRGHLSKLGLTDDVKNFSPDAVESFVQALAEAGNCGATVGNRISALSSLGQHGVRTKLPKTGKYILQENPCIRIERPKRQAAREKFLLRDELQKLLALDLPVRERLVVDLLIDTALRASELANAKVRDLTIDGERVTLQVTVKGGRPRAIPLGPDVAERLLASLREREADPGEPLLVNSHGRAHDRRGISQLVFRAAESAGIHRVPVRAHVLRHSVATLAMDSGADVRDIASLLNHSNLATAQRYIHNRSARVDSTRAAVRELLK